MAFRRIEEIRIGTMPPGEAFGGYIYDLKITFGFNGSPTTCTVSVINEDGIYNINQVRDLSTTNFVPIYITEPGGGRKFVHLNMMHLVEFGVQRTTDAKILVLEFVDHSIILDKIWVGLANRSAKTHNLMSRPGFINHYRYLFRTLDIPIKCHPCTKRIQVDPNTGQIRPMGTRERPPYGTGLPPQVEVKRIRYLSGGGFVSNIDPLLGGALLIGTQEFSNNECSIKEVSYNWRELEFALAKNNIHIARHLGTGLPSIHDRGKPQYRIKAADKPLKDVISSWCQELGFDWTWDPFSNMIYGRDLTIPLVDLTPIYAVVENWSALTMDPNGHPRSIITNLNTSSTLKGTKRQDHVSIFRKEARTTDYSTKRYKRVISENVTIENVIPQDKMGMKRTVEEFIISCSLAKFSTDARELYNVGLAEEKFPIVFPVVGGVQRGANIPMGVGGLEPLGINAAYKFSPQEANDLWNLFGLAGNLRPEDKNEPLDSAFTEIATAGLRFNFDVYLATYNEEMKGKWETWEKSIADFIGLWYTNDKEDKNMTTCLPTLDYDLKVTNQPIQGKMYSVSDIIDLPFSDILRGAPCPVGNQCVNFGRANTFNIFRTCWGQRIGDQAWRGTKSATTRPNFMGGNAINPNNQCCAYIQGIAQGTILIKGKTYRFVQSDRGWRRGNNAWKGCNLNEDACGEARGGRLIITRKDGSLAPGYQYIGTPGEPNSGAQITIADNEPSGTVLYLAQETQPMVTMGCGCDRGIAGAACLPPLNPEEVKHFQFLDGSNGFGEPFKERFMVIEDNPDEDDDDQLFVFKRDPKWGTSSDDWDGLVLNKEENSALQWLLPKKHEISEQMKTDFIARFAAGGVGLAIAPPNAALLVAPFVNALRRMLDAKVYLIFMPKKAHLDNWFKIGDKGLEEPIRDDGGKTININERVFKKNSEAPTEKTCRNICQFTFTSRVCRCWPGRDFDVEPETNGLSNNAARSFTVHLKHDVIFKKDAAGVPIPPGNVIDVAAHWRNLRIILPSEFSYWGFHEYDIRYRKVVRGINAMSGLIMGGGQAMSYNVNLKDITSDMDDLNPDPSEAINPQDPQNQAGAGAGLPGWEGGGKMVANLIVPRGPRNFFESNQQIVNMEKYHWNLLQGGNVINNDYPSQSLEFTVVGGYTEPLKVFLNPQWGCESLSITYGSQGLQTAFRFATRYPSPVPDQMLYQRINSEINLNVFGRTF